MDQAEREERTGKREEQREPREERAESREETEQTERSPGAGQRKPRARPWVRWTRRTLLALALLLVLPLLAMQVTLRFNYAGDTAEGTYTRDRDAIWLGHAWVDGRKTDADVTALAERLKDTGIRDLYVHAGPLEHDGTLPKSLYPRAGWLVKAVHRALPHVRVQAWLGDVLATEGPTGMRLDRGRHPRPRRRVRPADPRRRLPGRPLRPGAPALRRPGLPPPPGPAAPRHRRPRRRPLRRRPPDRPAPRLPLLLGHGGRAPQVVVAGYFGQVARRVDQIAVMSYDTMQPLESTYGGYVAQQTSLALEATPPGTDLLMGLPFYHENRFGHWAHAETVPARRPGRPPRAVPHRRRPEELRCRPVRRLRGDGGGLAGVRGGLGGGRPPGVWFLRTGTRPAASRPASRRRPYEGRRRIFDPSHTSGSYLRSAARSFSGISALSVILISSGHTSVQHLVMLQ